MLLDMISGRLKRFQTAFLVISPIVNNLNKNDMCHARAKTEYDGNNHFKIISMQQFDNK